MKTALLIGIEGTFNYGCEAIVRGTAANLRAAWPGARVVYASPRPRDDTRRLAGAEVEVVPRRGSRYGPRNLLRKALSFTPFEDWSPRVHPLSLLRGADAVLSIGGDIYTLRSDGSFDAAVPRFGDAALRRGVPYVLWGASVGPFDRNPRALRFFRRHLARVTLVAAREPNAVAYLSRLGVTGNVRPCVDPAFFVAPELARPPGPARGRPRIAVNLSPLSLAYAGLRPGETVAAQARAVEQLVEELDAEVLLVPHVHSADPRDDDVGHLARVRGALRAGTRHRVELLGGDPGFVGVKRALVGCDLVIAARMHCAVNAAAAAVPALFLSYSEKAQGMCEVVYGDREQVIGVDAFAPGPALRERVGGLIARAEALSATLRERVEALRGGANAEALRALAPRA